MIKFVVIIGIVTAGCGSIARAETRSAPPAQQKPQSQPDKPAPTPDEIAHWMSDRIDDILEPVETIIAPASK